MTHILIRVFCCNNHLVGIYSDEIREKYPFFCYECPDTPADLREGKYPWYATTEVVDSGGGTYGTVLPDQERPEAQTERPA